MIKNNKTQNETAILYTLKQDYYFSGARTVWINRLPENRHAKILEIGCGNGNTGALAKAEKKCDYYAGIELVEKSAQKAMDICDHVICGNAETIEFPWSDGYFDVILMSEVIEHLIDPWAFLRKLHRYAKTGALLYASSPNVCHKSVLKMLLKGEWLYCNKGIMDQTHLRWFTPKSYRRLFEECGYTVTMLKPVKAFSIKAKVVNFLTFGLLNHVFWKQIDLQAKK